MPKISVIVPVYNVEKYLPRCIDSILAQTFRDFELILVDDGSQDNCGAICDEYVQKDSRVHALHQRNNGVSAARNAGLDWVFSNSNSDWITFVDSDDQIHPLFLEHLYNLAVHTCSPVSVCQFISLSDPAVIDFNEYLLDENPQNVIFSQYYSTPGLWSVSLCNKLYRSNLFQTIRFPVGRVLDDVFVTYRVLYEAQQIVVSKSVLYYYFIREGSAMHRKYHLKYLDGLDACKQQLQFFVEKNDSINAQTAFHQLAQSYASHCKSLASEPCPEFKSKRKELIQELRQLLKTHRSWVSVTTDAAPMEVAYPNGMWCYWTFRGLLNKFKKDAEK